jgi:AmmeMemoRadiSam system protein B
MDSENTRSATHAGSWYSGDGDELGQELDGYLENAKKTLPDGKLKGIIGPHAGYAYSGPTAAWAYINIDPSQYKRVFLLGPAHHTYLDGWALSKCSVYETPLGDINIDTDIVKELHDTGKFKYFSHEQDEEEHSLEMHLPYIKKIFGDQEFSLVPIVVGSINYKKEKQYGQLLAEYIKDDDNLFIISSDFCHWGTNFNYMPHDKSVDKSVSGYIKHLDHQGMKLVEQQDAEKFVEYLKDTGNTVCGRHPITVFLEAVKSSGLNTITKFVQYNQSGKIKNKHDSSVSYASSYTMVSP